MPKRAFALEEAGGKRLEVSWKGIYQYKDITVLLDGTQIGLIPDQKSLLAGQEFSLVDGSTIKIQLVPKFTETELQVLRNGQPIPGSASDPQTRLKNAYQSVYIVATLNIVFGLIAVLFNPEFLHWVAIGSSSILFGLAFLPLGFFIQRKSILALVLAIIIMIADGLVGFHLAVLQGYDPGGGVFMARIFFLVPLFLGFSAIKAFSTKSA